MNWRLDWTEKNWFCDQCRELPNWIWFGVKNWRASCSNFILFGVISCEKKSFFTQPKNLKVTSKSISEKMKSFLIFYFLSLRKERRSIFNNVILFYLSRGHPSMTSRNYGQFLTTRFAVEKTWPNCGPPKFFAAPVAKF